jgi:hypothetical protein
MHLGLAIRGGHLLKVHSCPCSRASMILPTNGLTISDLIGRERWHFSYLITKKDMEVQSGSTRTQPKFNFLTTLLVINF